MTSYSEYKNPNMCEVDRVRWRSRTWAAKIEPTIETVDNDPIKPVGEILGSDGRVIKTVLPEFTRHSIGYLR